MSPTSIFLLLSIFYFRKAAIISTAYLGSYFFVAGVTLYTGQKVFSPLNFLKHWAFGKVTLHFYICFGLIYLCAISAAIWQYWRLRRYEKKRKTMLHDIN